MAHLHFIYLKKIEFACFLKQILIQLGLPLEATLFYFVGLKDI